MIEVVGNKILVDGEPVSTVHEYVESPRRYVIGGAEYE